jgi:hypothetical protein
MQLHCDLHVHPNRFANLTKRFDSLLDLLCGDVLAIGRIRELIERPDLHRGNAHVEQLARQLTRLIALQPLEQSNTSVRSGTPRPNDSILGVLA